MWTVPLSRATQLGLRRSFWGRVFGYGQFVLDGAEARQAIRSVNFMPYPEQLYLEIIGLIFIARDDDDRGGDDRGGDDQDGDNPGDETPGDETSGGGS